MGTHYSKTGFGFYTNGMGQLGTNEHFEGLTFTRLGALSNGGCFEVSNSYGATFLGSEFVAVDTTKTYQHAVSVKTTANNYLGNPGSGHLGYSCYDVDKAFISLQGLGGRGDTTLSRAANANDTSIYITDNTGWHTGTISSESYVSFYPTSHSKYNIAHERTEFFQQYDVNQGGPQWTGSDYSVLLNSSLTNFGEGELPIGTAVSNGRSGSTYNYVHGSPTYPTEWTTYYTSPFTGELGRSSTGFRYHTKYIKFLNLRNYNYRTEQGGASATYLLDNVILVEVTPGKTYPSSVFSAKRGI